MRTRALILAILIPAAARSQVIIDMHQQGGGVITTTDAGALTGDEYQADGIIFQWEQILKEYEKYDGGQELETIAKEEDTGKKTTAVNKEGKTFSLPEIIDENGIDLFLLTEDGISIYMAIDSPVYYQETTPDIIKWIRYYAYQKRAYTKKMFKRYSSWEGRIKKCFRQYQVPEELGELCLIESGCTTDARSHAGALGMWQIMPETGRGYGMIINQFMDERLDPEKSLIVAARILRDCRKHTGDWTLAAASYNCGSGHIIKQQKKGRGEWQQIKPYIPKETQQYIPSLLAIHYVWTYREKLGLQ